MTQSNLKESGNRPNRFPSLRRRQISNWLSSETILAAAAVLDSTTERRNVGANDRITAIEACFAGKRVMIEADVFIDSTAEVCSSRVHFMSLFVVKKTPVAVFSSRLEKSTS